MSGHYSSIDSNKAAVMFIASFHHTQNLVHFTAFNIDITDLISMSTGAVTASNVNCDTLFTMGFLMSRSWMTLQLLMQS